MIFISDKKLNYIIGGAMKNLLSAIVVLGVFLLTGCEKVNPVSSLTEVSENSQQKNIDIIPDPYIQSFYGSFQSSGNLSTGSQISILEIFGNGSGTGIGNSKLFSFTRINSTTQTGSIDITTTKGDKITGTLSGTVQSGSGNILYFSGTYKLIHGTGSLSGVTGTGKYTGNFYKNSSTGKFILDGTIHWPEVIRIYRNASK